MLEMKIFGVVRIGVDCLTTWLKCLAKNMKNPVKISLCIMYIMCKKNMFRLDDIDIVWYN